MIRLAKPDNLEIIMEIIKSTVHLMNREGNYQWDETYPSQEDIFQDITSNTLYIHEEMSQIKGVICVNMVEPLEYASLPWGSDNKATVIHRMAVSNHFRKQGVGKKLFTFAEEQAKISGTNYIKTDTYSINNVMNGMLLNSGFKKVGEIEFKNKPLPFNCYEKFIQVNA